MQTSVLVALVVGAVLGALAATGAWRLVVSARTAALAAERDVLRERVTDLETSTDHDRELAATLAPLSSALVRVEGQVRVLERDRVEQYARLGEQLEAVRTHGEALRVQTSALAGALRSPTARGAWGEVQLRRVIEHAGMLARVDFDTQVAGTTAAGDGVRPDVVVRLPGGKHVVVDAKAPLAAFLEASEESQDPARQAAAAAAHARALRAHVDALAAKEYWTAFDPSPELVVCFVPGEAFLAAACAADPALLEHAMARRVVLATPTTLLALLRTVALTWQSEALSGSARALFDLGRELYGRLGSLGGVTSKLGRSLHRAVEDYNALVGTMERRVLVSARRMRDLDVTDLDLETLAPVEVAPRPLTAAELIEAEHREALPPLHRDWPFVDETADPPTGGAVQEAG
ncbi:DNA recombination protein RmuC [Kineosporia sp. R_H_3]|uniref:DNA recombination protein RmuC n=1 Tax=Kineosporia sp. R_H_3 TaxID=1961848 RepID=UPI000B4AFC12|nr:DNA recombination protein RmuC [Kineosporia sp. R_H_3]